MTTQTRQWTEPRRKIIGVPLVKDVEGLGKQTDGTYIVRGFFTSDKRDEIGDTITRQATKDAIPNYRQWGNIRYMHMPRPVGKITAIGEDDGLKWNEVEIKVIDPQAVFEVEQGLLTALSVGILVNFEDIEFEDDGGWIINSYKLAEISLVDHPANYDAKLKLSLDASTRDLAREYGFDAVAQTLVDLIKENEKMAEQTDTIVPEEQEVPAEELEVEKELEGEQPESEEEEIEKTLPVDEDQTEEEEVEKSLEDEDALPEDGVEDLQEVEKDLEEVEETPADEPTEVQALITLVHTLIEKFDKLFEMVEKNMVTVPEASGSDNVEDDVEQDEEEIVKEITGTAPANRKSAVLETEDIEEDEEVAPENEKAPNTLRGHLERYLKAKHG